MRVIVVVSVLCLFISGCAYDIARNNLNKLEVDMTKAQVIKIMGAPYRREAQGNIEWLLYQTDARGDYSGELWQAETDLLTPLVIEDGKLVGWGKSYWTTKEQKYDVKIEHKLK